MGKHMQLIVDDHARTWLARLNTGNWIINSCALVVYILCALWILGYIF